MSVSNRRLPTPSPPAQERGLRCDGVRGGAAPHQQRGAPGEDAGGAGQAAEARCGLGCCGGVGGSGGHV